MPYDGDVDAYMFFDSWFRDAMSLKLTAIENVAFMFKRHLKGIIRAWVTKANNGKAERMNGSITGTQAVHDKLKPQIPQIPEFDKVIRRELSQPTLGCGHNIH